MTNSKNKSRTGNDFSKHDYIVEATDQCQSYQLKLWDRYAFSVNFINAYGKCMVTGDYGNYMFNREIHPEAGERVSDDYWCEKLSMYSFQDPYEYDSEGTKEALEESLKEFKEENELKYRWLYSELSYDRKQKLNLDDDVEEHIEYLESCIEYSDDWDRGESYRQYANNNLPDNLDYEDVIFAYKIKDRLLYIFDAFEEMCRREENKNPLK